MCQKCDVEFERLHRKVKSKKPLSEMEREFCIQYIADNPVHRPMLQLMLGDGKLDPWLQEELASGRDWERNTGSIEWSL
jgi:hypothetical protein